MHQEANPVNEWPSEAPLRSQSYKWFEDSWPLYLQNFTESVSFVVRGVLGKLC